MPHKVTKVEEAISLDSMDLESIVSSMEKRESWIVTRSQMVNGTTKLMQMVTEAITCRMEK
jgi:hypothetical protein